MAAWEGKKYKLEKSENFDEYMKELGVGLVLRKMGNSVSPTIELTKNGDVYTLTTSSTFKTSSISFKLGEEFDEETIDGRKVKSVVILEGANKFIHEQKGEKPTTVVREFTENEVTVTCTIGNIKSLRVYKAV